MHPPLSARERRLVKLFLILPFVLTFACNPTTKTLANDRFVITKTLRACDLNCQCQDGGDCSCPNCPSGVGKKVVITPTIADQSDPELLAWQRRHEKLTYVSQKAKPIAGYGHPYTVAPVADEKPVELARADSLVITKHPAASDSLVITKHQAPPVITKNPYQSAIPPAVCGPECQQQAQRQTVYMDQRSPAVQTYYYPSTPAYQPQPQYQPPAPTAGACQPQASQGACQPAASGYQSYQATYRGRVFSGGVRGVLRAGPVRRAVFRPLRVFGKIFGGGC